jgi:Lipoate-protein ligase A
MVILQTPSFDVYSQMAIDEIIACDKTLEDKNFLRFFNWQDKKAITFGYAQRSKSLKEQFDLGYQITRRPSGGGVVYHEGDLTFSIIFTSTDKVEEIYKKLHTAIAGELKKYIKEVQNYDQKNIFKPVENGQSKSCFANPVLDDLMVDGKKILGGAIRRFGNRILYQGTLQITGARGREEYKTAIKHALEKYFQEETSFEDISSVLLAQIKDKAEHIYKNPAWINKY